MLYGIGSDCIFINKNSEAFSGGCFSIYSQRENVDKLSCTGMGIGVESLHSDCYNIVIVAGTILMPEELMTFVKVYYLNHSGFAVETDTKVLIFDYYRIRKGIAEITGRGKAFLVFCQP